MISYDNGPYLSCAPLTASDVVGVSGVIGAGAVVETSGGGDGGGGVSPPAV